MTIKNRKDLVDPESVGYFAIKALYENLNKGGIETRKKNGIPINIKLYNSDLEILDFIAKKFGVTRNWLVAEILESDVVEMLNAFEAKPQYELAIEADVELSKKNIEHAHNGATWLWDVVGPNPEVFNPANKGIKELKGE